MTQFTLCPVTDSFPCALGNSKMLYNLSTIHRRPCRTRRRLAYSGYTRGLRSHYQHLAPVHHVCTRLPGTAADLAAANMVAGKYSRRLGLTGPAHHNMQREAYSQNPRELYFLV